MIKRPVVATQPQTLEMIRLQPADGKLAVRTQPAGANVMIGQTFAGQTPLELTLTAQRNHLLQLEKRGVQQRRLVKRVSRYYRAVSASC